MHTGRVVASWHSFLLRFMPVLQKVFIKLTARLVMLLQTHFWWLQYNSYWLLWLALFRLSYLCLFDCFWRFWWNFILCADDSETKDVFDGVNKRERWILFVIHVLYFKHFPFEIDNPAHFIFLLCLSTSVHAVGTLCNSYRHSQLIKRVLFSVDGYFWIA